MRADRRGGGESFVEDDQVLGCPRGQRVQEHIQHRVLVDGDGGLLCPACLLAGVGPLPVLRRHDPVQRGRQCFEGGLRVGDQAEGHRMVLGDLVAVEIDVHDPGVRPERARQGREHLGEQVGPHDQYRVGLGDGSRAHFAEHVPEQATVQRVPAVDGDFGGVGTPHVGAQLFGDVGQRRLCARHHDAVAEDDFDRPAQYPQHRLRVDEAGGVFRHRTRHRDEVGGHLRVHRVVPHPGLTGDRHERGVAALGLVQHADRVAESHATVDLQQRRAAGGPGVSVGDPRRHSLLQREDVLETVVTLQRVEESLLDGSGVTEHVGQAVREELLDDR